MAADNLIKNEGFEIGPQVFKNSTVGVLLPPKQKQKVCFSAQVLPQICPTPAAAVVPPAENIQATSHPYHPLLPTPLSAASCHHHTDPCVALQCRGFRCLSSYCLGSGFKMCLSAMCQYQIAFYVSFPAL